MASRRSALLFLSGLSAVAGSVGYAMTAKAAATRASTYVSRGAQTPAAIAGATPRMQGVRVASNDDAGTRATSATPSRDRAEGRPAAGAAGRIVVLDPGHGGSNPGGLNPITGLREKDLTLDLAQRMAEELRAAGVTVLLTRQDDRSMTLRQRMMVANTNNADLFISVHTNASPTRTQRGYETFVLTPRAVDIDGRALRRDAQAGRSRNVAPAVAVILDDIERGAAQWDAAEFAADMQDELSAVRGPEGNRGVRQDAQHVLLGATMPAVLVEVGFLDHPIEGRELADPQTRARIAAALVKATLTQFENRRK